MNRHSSIHTPHAINTDQADWHLDSGFGYSGTWDFLHLAPTLALANARCTTNTNNSHPRMGTHTALYCTRIYRTPHRTSTSNVRPAQHRPASQTHAHRLPRTTRDAQLATRRNHKAG